MEYFEDQNLSLTLRPGEMGRFETGSDYCSEGFGLPREMLCMFDRGHLNLCHSKLFPASEKQTGASLINLGYFN
jgi:hypothetical protein